MLVCNGCALKPDTIVRLEEIASVEWVGNTSCNGKGLTTQVQSW